MNRKFYKKLLSFRSHSNSTTQIEFRNWLAQHILHTHDDAFIEYDEYGNMYVTKQPDEEKQPYVNCVVAHLDINQKVYTDSFSIIEAGDFIVGMNNETGLQIGLGHDDKAGVYFALQALKKFKNIKCFFPLNEEIGLLGSKASDTEFFEDVGFLLQLDRRGYSDISEFTNGIDTVTKSTKFEFNKILAKYNFHWTKTVSTDVGHLISANGIQGTNISCAYLNEHTDTESFSISRYETCQKFALAILKHTDGKHYPMYVEKKIVTTTTTGQANQTTTTQAATATNQQSSTTTTASTATNTTPTTTNGSTTTTNVADKTEAEKKSSNVITPVIENADPLEEVREQIEQLYDYDSADVFGLKELVTKVHDKWLLLDDCYQKHCLIYVLHEAIECMNHSIHRDSPLDLETELLAVTLDVEQINQLYCIESVNNFGMEDEDREFWEEDERFPY